MVLANAYCVHLAGVNTSFSLITHNFDVKATLSFSKCRDRIVKCELTRHFHPVLSPSCVAEDSRSGGRFQVGLNLGSPCLQLASSSSAPRARRCGKKKVLEQLSFGMSCSITKPSEPSLHEQCRYTCKAEAATQFHGWHTISAPYS